MQVRRPWHGGRVDFSSPTPDATRDLSSGRFGARPQPWWDQLAEVLAELEEGWELVVGDTVGRGNTSLVSGVFAPEAMAEASVAVLTQRSTSHTLRAAWEAQRGCW
jgi:hypothetical protein